MNIIVVCKDSNKFSEFLSKQGSLTVIRSFDSISSNTDTLMNNIVRADKFVYVYDPSVEIGQEVRALLTLLDSPHGLLQIGEIVCIYKKDSNTSRVRPLLDVVAERIKEKKTNNPTWEAPNFSVWELDGLGYENIYRTIMGRSSFDIIEPSVAYVYRIERGDDSKKAFEYKREDLTIHTKNYSSVQSHEHLKEILRKTENPTPLLDSEEEIPEYDSMNLITYHGLEDTGTKWAVFTGDRRSGVTTYLTAMTISAAEAGKTVLVLDLSLSGGLADTFQVANYDIRMLNNQEMLDSSMALDPGVVCGYENSDPDIMFGLLTYVRARPNIFQVDLILVNCNLGKLDTVLGIVNPKFCTVFLVTLLFNECVKNMLDVDTRGAKTIVWFNDNVLSPARKNKYGESFVKDKIKEKYPSWKIITSVLFEDFDLDSSIFGSIENVI